MKAYLRIKEDILQNITKPQGMNTEKYCKSKQEFCATEPSNWSFPLTLGAFVTETVA